MRRYLLLAAAAVGVAGCDGEPEPAASEARSGLAQSHAPSHAYAIETVAEGLDHPWSLAFLPDGAMLVTERAGRLRLIRDGVLVPDPVTGVPAVYAESQGGLMEIALGPDFAETGTVFLSYASGGPAANATALFRARFDGARLVDGETVFTARPDKDTAAHYGGRIALLDDGTLLLTLGDGFVYREDSQRLDNHLGTIVRLNPDGSAPSDNPVFDADGALAEIFSYGHRNVQGIVVDAETGRIWSHEHGPQGGDELNVIVAGANYGWPIATSGIDYSGARISPFSSHDGFAAPEREWSPSIAPAGLALYDGDRFPSWSGDLFIAALAARDVRRIDLEGDTVVGEEILFAELGERIRDVRVGPDGFLYLLTDAEQGRVLRVVPAATDAAAGGG